MVLYFIFLLAGPASIDSEWGYRNGLVSVIYTYYLVAFLTNDLWLKTETSHTISSILNNDLWEDMKFKEIPVQ